MTIKTGETLPSAKLRVVTDDGSQEIDAATYFQGKRAILFAVPGAFTPVCTEKHLPGYIDQAADFEAKGIALFCLSVNDPFVMRAWGQQAGTEGKITLLADSSGELTKALGLDIDLSSAGLGVRAKRFALTLDDGIVKDIQVDASTNDCDLASASCMIRRTASAV